MKDGFFYFVILTGCVILAVLCNVTCKKQAKTQAEVDLRPVAEIQQILVDRGHDIKVDGIWGPETDLALTIEVTK